MANCTRLVAIGGGGKRVLCGGEVRFQPFGARGQFAELVGQRQRRHHREPRVADLAEFATQAGNAPVKLARQIDQVRFLAVFAGHAELPAVDGDTHLRHEIWTMRFGPPSLKRAHAHAYLSLASTPRIVVIA